MESLSEKVKSKLDQERKTTIEKTEHSTENLKNHEDFKSLSQLQQQDLLKPFMELINRAKEQNNIANLIIYRNSLGSLYTTQLNQLQQLIGSSKGKEEKAGTTATPLEHYVNIKVVEKQINFENYTLSNEAEVNTYVEKIRKALLKEIEQNKKITLH